MAAVRFRGNRMHGEASSSYQPGIRPVSVEHTGKSRANGFHTSFILLAWRDRDPVRRGGPAI
jgi:hypothetical protein